MTFSHDEVSSTSSDEDHSHHEEDPGHADSGAPAHAAAKRGLLGFSLFSLFKHPSHTHRSKPGTVASILAVLAALIAPAYVAGLSLLGGNAPAGSRAAAAARQPSGIAASNTSNKLAQLAGAAANPNLPAATTPPAPAPPSLASAPPLTPHEVFGFAPYWTLSQESGFNVAGISTIAYFSLDVNANGSVQKSGAGWDGYNSQALADLVTRAHAAGDRVVLTVNDFDQTSLDQLTSSPTAPKMPVAFARELTAHEAVLEGRD